MQWRQGLVLMLAEWCWEPAGAQQRQLVALQGGLLSLQATFDIIVINNNNNNNNNDDDDDDDDNDNIAFQLMMS